jgi:hypothetical protein
MGWNDLRKEVDGTEAKTDGTDADRSTEEVKEAVWVKEVFFSLNTANKLLTRMLSELDPLEISSSKLFRDEGKSARQWYIAGKGTMAI